MAIRRAKAAKTKGGCQRSHSSDFISQLSDDVLLMVLSLLPIKDAVVTSCLSTRWRFLWCNLCQLNIDGSEGLAKIAKDRKLCESERLKFVNMVNGAIGTYNHPGLEELRIRFDLDYKYGPTIIQWLRFAADKNVEALELDLMEVGQKSGSPLKSYSFPFTYRYVWHLYQWPPQQIAVVELVSLKKLVLKGVTVIDVILHGLITNSPNLETISIHHGGYLRHVKVGERHPNLKHIEMAFCDRVKSIYLYDFDLVSFTYKGPAVDLRISDCPKLKEIDIIQGKAGFENTVYAPIKSCASSLEILSLAIYHPKASLKLDSVPELPNVKTLKLMIGAYKDVCLLQLASIIKACSSLETFKIELLWHSKVKRRSKVKHVAAARTLEHLKLLEFVGYYGRISDLELVAYVIKNALALKKIVIDPRCQGRKGMLKTEEASRSSAKRQLESLIPRSMELVIL